MRKSTLVALLVAGSLLIPAAVYASHQFTDVPDSHTFHNAIDWMKDNNITVGCNPPANTQYCPDDNVTRGQMAAFMKRLAENNVVDAATLDGKDSPAYTNPAAGAVLDNRALALNTVVELAEVSIEAPVAGGLVVTGQVTPNFAATGQATFWFQADNATCDFSGGPFFSIDYGRIEQAGSNGTSSSAAGVVAVGAGPHTVTFCGRTFAVGPLNLDASLVVEFVTSVTRTGTLSSADAGDGGGGLPTR